MWRASIRGIERRSVALPDSLNDPRYGSTFLPQKIDNYEKNISHISPPVIHIPVCSPPSPVRGLDDDSFYYPSPPPPPPPTSCSMALKNRVRYIDELIKEDQVDTEALVKELKTLQISRRKGSARRGRMTSGCDFKQRKRSLPCGDISSGGMGSTVTGQESNTGSFTIFGRTATLYANPAQARKSETQTNAKMVAASCNYGLNRSYQIPSVLELPDRQLSGMQVPTKVSMDGPKLRKTVSMCSLEWTCGKKTNFERQ